MSVVTPPNILRITRGLAGQANARSLPRCGPGDHRLWPAPAGPGRLSRSPLSPVPPKSGV